MLGAGGLSSVHSTDMPLEVSHIPISRLLQTKKVEAAYSRDWPWCCDEGIQPGADEVSTESDDVRRISSVV